MWSAAMAALELFIVAMGCVSLYVTKTILVQREFQSGTVVVRGWLLLPIGIFFCVAGLGWLIGGIVMLWERV